MYMGLIVNFHKGLNALVGENDAGKKDTFLLKFI